MAKTDSKALMTKVVKYHFWVVSVVALAVGGVCWVLATGTLSDQYNRRVQKITGDLKKVQGIAAERNHPNSELLGEVEKARKDVAGNVLTAWRELYDRQEKGNPWPKSLGEDFLTKIAELKPTAEIPIDYREIYSNFIRTHLPELKKIVRARATSELKSQGGGNVKPADLDAIVDWVESDFNRIESRFKAWSTVPSSAEVRLAQESLWVYEALLKILRDTNKDATSREYAAVKRIEALEIGKAAAGAWGRGGQKGGESESSEVAPPLETEGELGASPDGGGASGALSKSMKELLEHRYVNEKGIPLAAGARGPFPQYKMMPIHLRLLMRQDRIPNLLMECANSTMPVEVRQVRLSEGGGRESGRSIGGDDMDGASRSGVGKKAFQTLDIMVEVFGIISIFNPPPTGKAATEEAMSGAEPSAEGTSGGGVPDGDNTASADNPSEESK